MKQQGYHLDNTVTKTKEDIILWKNEKGCLEITKDTLAVRIILDDQQRGCVFHGSGRLLIDTIVETDEGAVGNPVEKVLDTPFLMLGKLNGSERHLDDTKNEDFAKLGYDNRQQFISRAEELLDLFFEGSEGRHRHSKIHENRGFVFAFPNDSKLDILAAEDSKMVYTSTSKVFVSKGDKVVLTSHGRVVVSKPGKSVFIINGHIWANKEFTF